MNVQPLFRHDAVSMHPFSDGIDGAKNIFFSLLLQPKEAAEHIYSYPKWNGTGKPPARLLSLDDAAIKKFRFDI